jgi:LacI family transcriptional regulator
MPAGRKIGERMTTTGDGHPTVTDRPANIRDVARLAEVSPGTVSKVLNEMPGIAAATRERVLRAREQLDYRPNELVRGIFSRRSFTVGLLTSDSFGRFSGPIMAGAEDALGQGQLSVIMCDSRGDVSREAEHLDALVGRRVDGLIVTGRCSNLRPPVAASLPFPVVYAHTPSSDPKDLSIMVDDEGAGRLAADHLIGVGRRKIAHITGPWDFDAVHKRSSGFIGTLADHGLTLVGKVQAGFWCEAWGREATKALLNAHPDIDAIYCGSDLLARGAADALRESGRSVPEDVAIVGTDNWQLIAEATRPPLTTVDLNLNQVGLRSAQALVQAIEGERLSGQESVPANLVVRGSTGLPFAMTEFPHAGRYHESCIHPAQA